MIVDLLGKMSRAEEALTLLLGQDLSANKTLLLYLLLRRGATPPSFLAKELHLSRGRMSHLLDEMEGDDLLKRSPDPDDGRGYLVALTAKGLGLARQAESKITSLEASLGSLLGQGGSLMLLEQLEDIASLAARKGA